MRKTTCLLAALGTVVAWMTPAGASSPGVTFRASEGMGGVDSDGESSRAVISGDGNYIVYHSEANNLVAGDGLNTRTDIFRTNLLTGQTDLVSVALDGGPANGWSSFPAVSHDGRYVAFQSFASNLVAGDSEKGDVFRRDMSTGVTEKVSVSYNGRLPAGLSTRPSISWDGNLVAFNSNAANIVPDDTNGKTDVFVRDMAAGSTRLVADTVDEGANGDSIRAIVSGDGRYVVFASGASNLVPGDTNNAHDIFRAELATGIIERASVTSTGENIAGMSQRPWISGDGRYVVFQSSAGNVVPGDTNGKHDIFRRDMQAGITERVSVTPTGENAKGASTRAVINGDGRYVAFASNSRFLVAKDRNGDRDVFLRDMVTGVTQLVSVTTDGVQGNCPDDIPQDPSDPGTPGRRTGASGMSTRPTVSADGLVIGFVSGACNLDPDDHNLLDDIYIRNIR